MIEFKEEYNEPVKHDIEIVVHNARTHTAQVVNINEFRHHPNGHCHVETLEFSDDNGETIERLSVSMKLECLKV